MGSGYYLIGFYLALLLYYLALLPPRRLIMPAAAAAAAAALPTRPARCDVRVTCIGFRRARELGCMPGTGALTPPYLLLTGLQSAWMCREHTHM